MSKEKKIMTEELLNKINSATKEKKFACMYIFEKYNTHYTEGNKQIMIATKNISQDAISELYNVFAEQKKEDSVKNEKSNKAIEKSDKAIEKNEQDKESLELLKTLDNLDDDEYDDEYYDDEYYD